MNYTVVPADTGYRFHPPERLTAPGATQLDVSMLPEQVMNGSALQYMRVSVLDPVDGLAYLTIHHPWDRATTYQLLPDRIVLRNHCGKYIQAFTFGATLQIASELETTYCTITSPVPILDLRDIDAMPALLAIEAEIALVERQIAAERKHSNFSQRLANINPLTLYAACMLSIKAKLTKQSFLTASQVQLLRTIVTEIDDLRTCGVAIDERLLLERIL